MKHSTREDQENKMMPGKMTNYHSLLNKFTNIFYKPIMLKMYGKLLEYFYNVLTMMCICAIGRMCKTLPSIPHLMRSTLDDMTI